MAGDDDDDKDDLAERPNSEPKIRRKQIKVPKPIIVPDSCKLTADGGLDSPWMKLGREIGLDLTAPRMPEHENDQRTPKPIDELNENAPTAEPKVASANKKASSSKQKRAASSPSTGTFTPKKPRKSKAKMNMTPSKRASRDAPGGDISYWSSKSHLLRLPPSRTAVSPREPRHSHEISSQQALAGTATR